jgi:hypothetical protein
MTKEKQNSGTIKLSKVTEIIWMRGDRDGELYAAIWVNGRLLTARDPQRSVSGWWRTDDPELLKARISGLYAREIAAAEEALAALGGAK